MSEPPKGIDYRALLKEAALSIERLQQRLEQQAPQPVAIVGLGCRFPGGVSAPEQLWTLLRTGTDAVTEVPRDRWDIDAYYDPRPDTPGRMYTRRGGFLSAIDQFDAEFFGISPREAVSMDPQQRLLLEVAWEALERAAIAPSSLAGSPTGVYVGVSGGEYMGVLGAGGPEALDAYFSSGNSHSIAAGRLSYVLGLHGPSLAVDTACSSSLVAVHLACQALNNGDCSLALAAGVNLILLPEGTVVACRAHMMAADGRCKTFDAAADGFVRAEGCGVVVLKRLADAERDGDRILAVIRGSAVNQDGRSGGLTVPSGPAQEAAIRQALARARLAPDDVGYIEAHGTGTSLGDPIELRALGAVFGGRSPATPLVIGSVKTNLGHLEAAAGIAGLAKVILSLQHGEIPAHLHFHQPNPHIPWSDLPFVVPTQARPWPADRRRIAGLSSFGFSGTNAHVLIEQAPEPAARAQGADRPGHLLTLSARDPRALRELAGRHHGWIGEQPSATIGDICFTANAGRSHLSHRLALLVSSPDDARRQLGEVAAGAEPVETHRVGGTERPEVVFLFTGQGAQHASMSRVLFDTQPTFRRVLQECDELLADILDRRLLAVLFDESAQALLTETRYAQPALFAVEYALAQLWMAWGIRPAAVLGHSLGEYVAACVAGVFDLRQGIRLVAERGRLMQALPGGAMAAVFAPGDRVAAKIAAVRDRVSIAAINGPENTVISGPHDDVARLLGEFSAEGIPSQPLQVSHAFHSPMIAPMLDQFARLAAQVKYAPANIDLVCNLDGAWASPTKLGSADYWCRQAQSPVQFAASIRTLEASRHRRFLEIGPHPTLTGLARRCFQSKTATFLPSLCRGENDWNVLLGSLRQLYHEGFEIDWRGFDRDYVRRKLELPTYPFQRQRFWWTPAAAPQRADPAASVSRLLGRCTTTADNRRIYDGEIGPASHPHLIDHQLFGRVVVPGAQWVAMGLEALAGLGDGRGILRDLSFPNPLFLGSPRKLQMLLGDLGTGDAGFEIWSRDPADAGPWLLHARGRLRAPEPKPPGDGNLSAVRGRCSPDGRAVDALYSRIEALGVHLGPSFRWLRSAAVGNREALVELAPPANTGGFPIAHPGFLDSCFQALGLVIAASGGGQDADVYLPLGIESITLTPPSAGTIFCHAALRAPTERDADTLTGDIVIMEASGTEIGRIEGLMLKRAPRSALEKAAGHAVDDLVYRIGWRAEARPGAPAPTATGTAGPWFALVDRDGLGEALARAFEPRARNVCRIHPGKEFLRLGPREFILDPGQDSQWSQLLAQAEGATTSGVAGWIYAWGLDDAAEGDLTPGGRTMPDCRALFAVMQRVLETPADPTARLWIVTRLAQAVSPPEAVRPDASALWGLGRVFSREHHDRFGGLLDIDGPGGALDTVAAEIASGPAAEAAFRAGTRFVPDLERWKSPAADFALSPEGTYLVTGGLTGLGWQTARWLIERGARHLALVGRRGPGPEVAAALADYSQRGIKISVASVDITSTEAVDRFVADLDRGSPALRGIVHSAGIVDDGLLHHYPAERFAQVMAPKVEGAINLHRATRGRPLDFLVFYSSLASTLGSPTQGAYAAANAFLDGFAQRLRADGCAALSIAWGPWSGVGMAATVGEAAWQRMKEIGLSPLSTTEGLAVLERAFSLLASPGGHLLAARADWGKIGAADPAWAAHSPVRRWRPQSVQPTADSAQAVAVPDLSAGSGNAEGRAAALAPYLRDRAARILRLPAARVGLDVPLVAQGLDSLMALELRNRVQEELRFSLPLATFVSGPSVSSLAREIAAVLNNPAPKSEGPAASRPPAVDPERATALLNRLDELSDVEVESLIDELGGPTDA